MIVGRGYKPAGNFHDAKRLSEPLSHYFYVMTNGYGAMPDYKAQVAPEDRWAIAAYIRALQLSQNAKTSDVPAGAQVENLSDIADAMGHKEYAGPWPMPSTAVTARPQTGIVAGAPAQVGNPQSSTPPAMKTTTGETSKPPARPSGEQP
jgi:hypothetical protein